MLEKLDRFRIGIFTCVVSTSEDVPVALVSAGFCFLAGGLTVVGGEFDCGGLDGSPSRPKVAGDGDSEPVFSTGTWSKEAIDIREAELRPVCEDEEAAWAGTASAEDAERRDAFLARVPITETEFASLPGDDSRDIGCSRVSKVSARRRLRDFSTIATAL